MELRFTLLLLALQTVTLMAAQASGLAGERVRFCADEAQWPPYSYTIDGGPVRGYTIDLINLALKPQGVTPEFEQMPWKRCMAETRRGDRYQVAIDASSSEARTQNYLLTRSYYQLTPHYFYSRRQFPRGLEVADAQALPQTGRVCGLSGYNYTNFGVPSDQIYRGAPDFYALAEMTHRGRCALFLGRYEIVAGLARIGRDLLSDPELAWAPIPGTPPEPFYLLISRGYPQAAPLKQLLDQAITRLEQTGQLDALMERHR